MEQWWISFSWGLKRELTPINNFFLFLIKNEDFSISMKFVLEGNYNKELVTW